MTLTAAQAEALKVLARIRAGHARDVAAIRFPGRDPKRTATGVGCALGALRDAKLADWRFPDEVYSINERGDRWLQENGEPAP